MNERDLRRINVKSSIVNHCNDSNKTDNSLYVKEENVNYDVIICIPSYNRYDKLKRLINQFYTQETKYTFKIVILDDGSNDIRYNTLVNEFPNIAYKKNDVSNGKLLHWYCYNQMWEYLKTTTSNLVLQMDDDFIICDNFLNIIIDLFFEKKKKGNKYMAISPHLWSFKKECEYERWWKNTKFVDGIALIDINVIKNIGYVLKPVNIDLIKKPGTPVKVWNQISNAIVDNGGIIYRTENSLVYHDGNDDSRLHGDYRNNGKNGIYTQKYIENHD